jgi:RimJ/RimL family protein N-acetyltransferase
MNNFLCLNQNIFQFEDYSLVPVRLEDKYSIMKWRNEQLFHLRQLKPLTKDEQDMYFTTVISKLFDQERPSQILFSYLKKNVCIGYGGLVHINWHDNIAEISFIMDTVLEKENFELNWTIFLTLIEEVAFQHLYFHKLFTYAFNLRPHLYEILEKNQFEKEAILKEHAKFENKYIDVVIHSKINGIDKI